MLGGGGDANVVASSGEAAAAPRHTAGRAPDSTGAPLFGDINSADEDLRGRLDEGGGGGAFGGNRWPRQETLALLQIRSDMDVAFRDASVKGPLWEDVSRKMADLGYRRSAKKCKEKFENVYKYHKRTKDGRTSKSDGKTYRFFDQLEALETQLSSLPSSRPLQHQPIALAAPPAATTAAQLIPPVSNHPPATSLPTTTSTVPSTMPVPHTISFSAAPQNSFSHAAAIINSVIQQPPAAPPPAVNVPPLFGNSSDDLLSNSTSASTSSDVQLEGRRKRKRKWKDFFERLMKGVIEKQEEMQKRFLEALERREQERLAREEAWRMQEMAKISREREILAQERSMAATKDNAVMTFLQKLSEQQNPSQPIQVPIPPPQPPSSAILTTPTPKPPAPPPSQASAPVTPAITPVSPQPQPQPQPRPLPMVNFGNPLSVKSGNGGDPNSMTPPSSSRWPKVEIEALIKLRTSMDAKYQENCPKGPLWEDISAAMRKLGYNRNAKRCKEKWENINKYFKKVKESNKKRPEDSKTCPYFHQLDALYSKRNKTDHMGPPGGASSSSSQMKPENSVPLLVRPEQQWPPASVMEDLENEQMDEEDDCEDDDEEDDQGGGYEIVASKPTVAMGAGE